MTTTQRKLWTLGAALTLIVMGLALVPSPSQALSPIMEFGTSVSGVDDHTAAGIKPNYGGLWAGPWTIDNWGYFDGQLSTLSSKGVTPVIQFYYWGNDLNINCWKNGCWSSVHGHYKSQAGWNTLASQLVSHLNSKMAGKKVVIVVETEFNKGDMGSSETLDAGLASKAWYLRNNYKAAVVALGFGNWGYTSWGVFDRAAAASHEMGLQGMRASTRDSVTSYLGLPSSLLKGAQELKNRFGKPVFIHDIAVSTYPEPEWLKHQATVIQSLFSRIGEFEAAGVHAFVYRSNRDSPAATTQEYYGQAERHFGLKWYSNGTAKPAFKAWKNGILNERGGAAPAPPPSTSGFTPTFTIKAPNEWWQELYLSGTSQGIGHVEVRKDYGAWQTMKKSSWGAWTSSYNTRAGSRVEFMATSTSGAVARSAPFKWLDGDLSQPTSGGTTSSTTTTAPSSAISVPGTGSAYKEIDTFTTRSAGSLVTYGTASGGKMWAMWSNGYVSNAASFGTPGIYEIRVRAQGESAQGIKPRMEVRLGDLMVLGASPASGSFADYVGKVSISEPTTKAVKISYTNDLRTSTEDRNLFLDRLEIRRVG